MSDLWQPVPFDAVMLHKYDRPGPRYTSYPAAPHFRDDFGAEDYEKLLARSAEMGRPLSLYVHIPFCRRRCFFCGCNVTIARNRSRGQTYLPLLDQEMERTARLLGAANREVVQIHWGGGTPTFLPPEDLAQLAGLLRKHFQLAEDCEFGVEIDPRDCTDEHLDALAEGGVNRISLGVQDLDPGVQEAVNRIQPLEMTQAVLKGAWERGIESVNLDLIYGLPLQTLESFSRTVEEILLLEPDRLAVFNFAYLPTMIPHQKVLDPGSLPDAGTKLKLLEHVIRTLTEAGYIFIGMDHFARPEDSLSQALRDRTLTRNFQGYSTRGECDLVGFGVSSIGMVADGYAQNLKELPAYTEAVGSGRLPTSRGLVMSPEDRLRRDVILRLMCHFRLDKGDVEETHGIHFDEHFAEELASLRPFEDDGLLQLEPDRIEITSLGRLLVRNIAMSFDAYLTAREATRYSRTV